MFVHLPVLVLRQVVLLVEKPLKEQTQATLLVQLKVHALHELKELDQAVQHKVRVQREAKEHVLQSRADQRKILVRQEVKEHDQQSRADQRKVHVLVVVRHLDQHNHSNNLDQHKRNLDQRLHRNNLDRHKLSLDLHNLDRAITLVLAVLHLEVRLAVPEVLLEVLRVREDNFNKCFIVEVQL